jgi:DNA (cytosine-5)-methyltransferase 1
MPERPTWPIAGWGDGTGTRMQVDVSETPLSTAVGHLSDGDYSWTDLSERALAGFVRRAREGNLRYPEGFIERLEARLR